MVLQLQAAPAVHLFQQQYFPAAREAKLDALQLAMVLTAPTQAIFLVSREAMAAMVLSQLAEQN
jgi:hypothetical protein